MEPTITQTGVYIPNGTDGIRIYISITQQINVYGYKFYFIKLIITNIDSQASNSLKST